MLYRVLLVLDDGELRSAYRETIVGPSTVVRRVATRNRLWGRLARETCDLVIVDLDLIPPPHDDSLRLLRSAPDAPDVLVVSREEHPARHATLVAAGAAACIPADLPLATVAKLVATLRAGRTRRNVDRLRHRRPFGEPRLSDFISASSAMQAFMDVVERTVESDASLLITGETGVGKERLARAIHAEGGRSGGPFIAVNCAALPDHLLESELFGHAHGAFTGAVRARRGYFELAHGGTLFLDEVGDLPLNLQPKLLRAVQERDVQPLGSERTVTVDVRIMAASNRDLEGDIGAGTFRRDLFYRLGVITLAVPALRERKEDVPDLVLAYLEYVTARIGRQVEGVAPAAMSALAKYSWPGNVRELRNVVERAVLLAEGKQISRGDLPESVALAGVGGSDTSAARAGLADGRDAVRGHDLPWLEARAAALERFEHEYFTGLLRLTCGRIGEAARLAGVSPRTINEKMRRLGIDRRAFRAG